jgi:hypothetical protein
MPMIDPPDTAIASADGDLGSPVEICPTTRRSARSPSVRLRAWWAGSTAPPAAGNPSPRTALATGWAEHEQLA